MPCSPARQALDLDVDVDVARAILGQPDPADRRRPRVDERAAGVVRCRAGRRRPWPRRATASTGPATMAMVRRMDGIAGSLLDRDADTITTSLYRDAIYSRRWRTCQAPDRTRRRPDPAATIRAMTETRLWDRAAALPARPDGRRLPEVARSPPGLPTVAELFDFMRDAELRFGDPPAADRGAGADGARRGPHRRWRRSSATRATPRSRRPDGDGAIKADYELWISDGELVRTYASAHRLGTQRPVRNRPRGLDDPDFPGPSRVYEPVTALPMETLPDTFVHPAGYCQNVLATGRCAVTGTDDRRPDARRSCSSATTRGRPSWPATGPTSTSRSRSTATPASSSAWSRRSAAPSPADAEVVELSPDAPLPADGLRLRLPDRDDDALLSPTASDDEHKRSPMSDHDDGHATKHPRLVELEEMVRDGRSTRSSWPSPTCRAG